MVSSFDDDDGHEDNEGKALIRIGKQHLDPITPQRCDEVGVPGSHMAGTTSSAWRVPVASCDTTRSLLSATGSESMSKLSYTTRAHK